MRSHCLRSIQGLITSRYLLMCKYTPPNTVPKLEKVEVPPSAQRRQPQRLSIIFIFNVSIINMYHPRQSLLL